MSLTSVLSPAIEPIPVATSIAVNVGPPVWSYELFNNEPQSSSYYIKAFQLSVAAPIGVVATPQGWQYDTDGSSYVLWFNAEQGLPYPHDIAPRSSLGGFEISSTVPDSGAQPASLFTWNHGMDKAGPISYSTVLVPIATGLVAISTRVHAESSGLVYNRGTRMYSGRISLTNISSASINGPIHVILIGVSAGAVLANAAGTYNGSSYLTVTASPLMPGRAVTVPLLFTYSGRSRLGYSITTYSGSF